MRTIYDTNNNNNNSKPIQAILEHISEPILFLILHHSSVIMNRKICMLVMHI